VRAQTAVVEALFQLFDGFPPRAPMPSSGGFALNPTDLLDLLHLVRTRKPKLVLELGSGTSTVWLAYALEKSGGRLVSLDHDPGYAEKTRAMLAAHGLTAVAEVRDAPLRPVLLDGRNFPWYDTDALADLHAVDLLLIDGPPEKTGPDARYPAMRVLEDKLADAATVVFDDAHRQDEQQALRKWVETIEGLTEEGEAPGRHAVLSYRRIVRQLAPQAQYPNSWVKYVLPLAEYTAPTPSVVALQLRMLARCSGLAIHAFTTSTPVRKPNAMFSPAGRG
jgi:predicted O-methyltransferase YrrM